jgi:general secretion pathway protein C
LAALAAGSAMFWTLKWPLPNLAAELPADLTVAGAQTAAPNPQAIAKLLGGGHRMIGPPPTGMQTSGQTASSRAVQAASRMHLAGVVSSGKQEGIALIAMDGKPAKPFSVGQRVDGDLLLQSVTPTRASLGTEIKGPAVVTLELPLRKG